MYPLTNIQNPTLFPLFSLHLSTHEHDHKTNDFDLPRSTDRLRPPFPSHSRSSSTPPPAAKIMGKTTRMSADEKRQAILGIYHRTKEVYTEKEIISLAAKAGVNQNT